MDLVGKDMEELEGTKIVDGALSDKIMVGGMLEALAVKGKVELSDSSILADVTLGVPDLA